MILYPYFKFQILAHIQISNPSDVNLKFQILNFTQIYIILNSQ